MAHRSTGAFAILSVLAAAFIGCGDASSTSGAGADGADFDEVSSFDADGSDASGEACAALGCACAAGADCAGGYCIDSADGAVCTNPCEDDCPDGWTCAARQDGAGESVRLCVPDSDAFCAPCTDDIDCGSPSARCNEGADGSFCATSCATSGLCPPGATCETGSADGAPLAVCVPLAGACTGCVDADEDGYGVGVDCVGEDCDDSDADTHAGADELCGGGDEDCDGTVDEGFDLTSDPAHCGGCDVACDPANGVGACVDGACTIASCDGGWDDCNGDVADGCETDLDGPTVCGACDRPANVCGGCETLPETPGEPCGTCGSGLVVCVTPETVDCVGDLGDAAYNACDGCEPLANEPGTSCGPCGLDEHVCVEGVTSDTACDGATLECTPGDGAVCEGDAIVGCLADGCGVGVIEECEPCGCADGACLPTVCTPGAERCNGRLAQRCDALGCGWRTFDDCNGIRNGCRFSDDRARCIR